MVSFELCGVGIDFPIYGYTAKSLRSFVIRPMVGGAIRSEGQDVVLMRALDDISFRVKKGERVGLIGHNGAGKSTLLRVLAGVYEPTYGRITRNGRIITLFDIAQGMLDELSGQDNIFTRGMLLGASRAEMARKLDEIVTFAELEDYIHLPVRTYSAGMKLRLAFAICTSLEADVVLMDEVIAIGDERFMVRANERLQNFVGRFGTIVLASHSIELVTSICHRTLVLSHGKIAFDGSSQDAVEAYSAMMR